MKRLSIAALFAAIAVFVAVVALRQSPGQPLDASPANAQSSASDAQKAAAFRHQITDDPRAPKVAPKGYDVTIVEYFDYQCPYCRKLHPALTQLLANDKKVRVVYRVWPIFGAPSVTAAKAVLASQYQGKYAAFDNALWQIQGKLSDDNIRAAAQKAGVDWARLQRDEKAHAAAINGLLSQTSEQAAMMGLQGTPGLLIGPYMIPGAVDYAGLSKAVELARKYPKGNAPGMT